MPGAEVTGGGLAGMSPAFAPYKLLETAIVLVLGGVLYRLTQTGLGGRVAHRIEATAPSLRTVLLFFFAGVVGFALVAAAA